MGREPASAAKCFTRHGKSPMKSVLPLLPLVATADTIWAGDRESDWYPGIEDESEKDLGGIGDGDLVTIDDGNGHIVVSVDA
jgi:hypothetical protein